MSLLNSRLSKLRLGKSQRSPLLLLLSNGFSTSLRKEQTPPCHIVSVEPCEPYKAGLGKLVRYSFNDKTMIELEKKVRGELVYNDLFGTVVTIGASNGWVATLNGKDGILRLQDDLNPYASYTDPRRISLPPLVTLPRCQTQIVTNVSMSSSSPEDGDCVVAVKFLGPQLSFCRPALSKPEWVNVRIDNPCFYSSRVMFSKKDNVFRILGAGGHLMGSWDLQNNHKHKIQRLRFENIPVLTKPTNEFMDSCCTYEHLVESVTTGETFMLKQYKKTSEIDKGIAKMKTRNLMVFKLDDEGNAVYTRDIGGLVIFLSKSEPFCVPASSSRMLPNSVETLDSCEQGFVDLDDRYAYTSISCPNPAPFFIPPQNIG